MSKLVSSLGAVTANSQFAHVSHNFHVCEYDLDPKLAGGRRVTIYAECSPTLGDPEGNCYWLRIYLSVWYNPTRELSLWATVVVQLITFLEYEVYYER